LPYPPQGMPIPQVTGGGGGGSPRLKCTITSDILYSDTDLEGERYTSSTGPVDVCQFTVNFVGSVRVYLELSVSNSLATAYAYVYRNGILVPGGVVSTSSQNYVAFTIDVNDCVEGDQIKVAYRINDSTFAAWLRRVRLLGKAETLTETPNAVRRDF